MIAEVKVPIVNAKAGKAATLKLDTVADRITLSLPAMWKEPMVEREGLERALAELASIAETREPGT